MSNLSGLFLINKTSGVTSHDVVFSLRKILKDKQVGHIGTLDPLADGLLVCLVGESVKLSDYLMGCNKKYRATLKLGEESDSWDATGKILKVSNEVISRDQIEQAIYSLDGEQSLPVPMYSAKKVDGKKLYELARGSENLSNFEGPLREMKFFGIKIIDVHFPFVTVEFECSKGSFVRSWIYSLGKRLGVGALMTSLTRLSIGDYDLDHSISIEGLRLQSSFEAIKNSSFFLDPWRGLKNRVVLQVEGEELKRLKSGLVSYTLSKRISELEIQGTAFCFSQKEIVAILNISSTIEVKRIFVGSGR